MEPSAHVTQLRNRIRSMPVSPPPSPWRRIAAHPVGGITDVGYAPGSDMLLVVTHDGRGVFDGTTGQRVARDTAPLPDAWHDRIRMTAAGIGPIGGVNIRLAGLWGRGLLATAPDSWSLEIVSPDWPEHQAILSPPGCDIFSADRAQGCTKVSHIDELRAWGFSETGRSFVLAQSHTLEIFGR